MKNQWYYHPIYKLIGVILILLIATAIVGEFEKFLKKYEYYRRMTRQVEKSTAKIPEKYREYTLTLCEKYNVPLLIFYKLIHTESRWNRYARSRPNRNGTRDYGIAQLNSRYIRGFVSDYYRGKEKFDVYNPKHSLEVSVKLLANHYRAFKNWYYSVCAYNAGQSSVRYRRIPASTIRYANKIMNFI